jgi:hypothetical protein
MTKIIVFVSGGNVQGYISDTPGNQVMIVDYDNEEGQERPERSFQEAPCDLHLFEQTLAGTENARA